MPIRSAVYEILLEITRVLTEININDDIRVSENTINTNRNLIHSISYRTNFSYE